MPHHDLRPSRTNIGNRRKAREPSIAKPVRFIASSISFWSMDIGQNDDSGIPSGGDNRFRLLIEQRFANYDPIVGEIDLSSCGIDANNVGWIVGRLGMLDGLSKLDIR